MSYEYPYLWLDVEYFYLKALVFTDTKKTIKWNTTLNGCNSWQRKAYESQQDKQVYKHQRDVQVYRYQPDIYVY